VFPDGCCYLDGRVVRTVVPTAAAPDAGRDDFYAVIGGVAGQKGVVAVGPGSAGYHGGDDLAGRVLLNLSTDARAFREMLASPRTSRWCRGLRTICQSNGAGRSRATVLATGRHRPARSRGCGRGESAEPTPARQPRVRGDRPSQRPARV